MYCRNCGAQIPEGNRFCENCGTPVPDLMQSGSAEDAKAGTGLILHHGMRKRTIIIIAVIAALVAGGIAGGIAAALSSHNESGKYQDKIDALSPAFFAYRTLGDHYDIEHCSHGELQAMMSYGDL